MERGVYDTNNQPNRATTNYETEGQCFLGVADVNSKNYKTKTGERFPMLIIQERKLS